MKKYILPVSAAVVAIALIVVIVIVSGNAKSLKGQVESLEIEKIDLQDKLVGLGDVSSSNDDLKSQLESYKDSLFESQALVARLTYERDSISLGWDECRGSKKKAVVKPVAKKPVAKAAVKKVVPIVPSAPPVMKKSTPVVEPVMVSAVSVQTVVADDGLAYLMDSEGRILCCFRVNGSRDGHFPHYAMDRNAKVLEAVDNGQKGYNLSLKPTETMVGNYGITNEGVFYVSARYLESYLNSSGQALKYVDLLYKGNWGGVRMTLSGNYYVYATK